MHKLTINDLPNGNYLVEVYKDNKLVLERAYPRDDMKSIISLILITFEPK